MRYLEQFVRAIGPGADIARPSILHATGLIRLGEGSIVAARVALETAVVAWDARGRYWELLWAKLDLASAHVRSSRWADAMALVHEVQIAAEAVGAEPLAARATQLTRIAKGRGEEQEPWHPLTTREFEVARAIAQGMSNPEMAEELGISPKTASSHVEHILAKLGATRRAEIAAWATSVMATRDAAAREPARTH
jgi:DNA-binding CsgD family transcriptional regulator